jgi:acylphosphatase
MQRLHVRVRGRVQGVYYRASTQETAAALGLCGWVRNCPDGSVELIAEGPGEALEQLLEWCRRGPPAARVDACESTSEAATGEFRDFGVRR